MICVHQNVQRFTVCIRSVRIDGIVNSIVVLAEIERFKQLRKFMPDRAVGRNGQCQDLFHIRCACLP